MKLIRIEWKARESAEKERERARETGENKDRESENMFGKLYH